MSETVYWFELREPDRVPLLKGPRQGGRLAIAFLRALMNYNPKAFITVVTIDEDSRPSFDDGPEWLEIMDGRSRRKARKHRETSKAAHATAYLNQGSR